MTELIEKLTRDVEHLARCNGFHWAYDYAAGRVTLLSPGIEPFSASLPEALAYLTGWDRCARNEGR